VSAALVCLYLTNPSERDLRRYMHAQRHNIKAKLQGLLEDSAKWLGVQERHYYDLLVCSVYFHPRDTFIGLARHWFSLGIPIPAMRQKWTIEQELNVLVVTQISVFFLWQLARIFVGKHFVASYHNLYARPWSLLLAPLSHADVFQLIVNVFAYLTFSPELRRSLGAVAFYRLYIGGSVFSLLCSVVLSKLLLHQNVERLGSNGGMYAMMSFHAFHLPNRVMRFLGYPMRAPLVLLASLLLDMATGHLDIIGHCAGAIYGAVYYLAYRLSKPVFEELLHVMFGQ